MNKPTANTAWATAESAKKVEPLESQRQSGWVYQDTPSSGVVNNWMNAVHQCVLYFESFGDPRAEIEDLKKRVKKLESELKGFRRKPFEEAPDFRPKIDQDLIPIFEVPLEIPLSEFPKIVPFPEQPDNPKGDPIYVDDDIKRIIDRTRTPLPLATENSLPEVDGQIGRLRPTKNQQ